MIRNVLILGGGSAGFLCALALKARNPELPLTLLRSKDLGIIGVGEAIDDLQPFRADEFVGALFDEGQG